MFERCQVAIETRGNCIVRLVLDDVDGRKRQFTLDKMDVSSHLQLQLLKLLISHCVSAMLNRFRNERL
jgi:hypothetical protein